MVYPHKCPICGIDTSYVYPTLDPKAKEEAWWYRCQCGVVFQDELPTGAKYDEKYNMEYVQNKEHELRAAHEAWTYAPLIEELTYGRMLLDVGYNSLVNMKYFEDRGWLTWGIDSNESFIPNKNLYKGDFMTYNFEPKVTDEGVKKLIEEKEVRRLFDVIWMGHVIEHFPDPIGALKKAYDLMPGNGVIYISTPDIEFINKTGISQFPHWRKHEHYILWSEGALKRELERIGFKVVMARRNFSSRYNSWYDVHIIAQKNYF